MAGLAVENLSVFASDIAAAMKEVDSRHPLAANAKGVLYKPGIGPHSETQTVKLVVEELQRFFPERYEGRLALGVSYPHESRQKFDVCIGLEPDWEWAIEVKMLRRMGDNGKPNDNILMHILSPYPQDRSALTDCSKLLNSEFHGRKAVVIYGYDYPDFPMDPAIEAFEVLAGRTVRLGKRCASSYKELVHPMHQAGRVFAWEVFE